MIVVAGTPRTTGQAERLLADSLRALGIETICLGHEQSAQRIAAVVAEERADAVELCLAGGGGVLLLRELLRELIEIGRRDTRIVVHRVGSVLAGSTA